MVSFSCLCVWWIYRSEESEERKLSRKKSTTLDQYLSVTDNWKNRHFLWLVDGKVNGNDCKWWIQYQWNQSWKIIVQLKFISFRSSLPSFQTTINGTCSFVFIYIFTIASYLPTPFFLFSFLYFSLQPSQKTFRTKRTLAVKLKQNKPIPHWIRLRTDSTIRYNAKRRHWRRTKLGI